ARLIRWVAMPKQAGHFQLLFRLRRWNFSRRFSCWRSVPDSSPEHRRFWLRLRRNARFGNSAPAGGSPGSTKPPETHHAPIANCLAAAKPATVSAHTSRGQLTKAAIPVVRQQELVGFFEISVARAGFSSEEVLAVSGLAEMVNTALDHLQAAENAHQQILQAGQPSKLETTAPLSWHAEPQIDPSAKAQAVPSPV